LIGKEIRIMGMSYKRKFEIRDRGKEIIAGIFSSGKAYGLNHIEMHNRYMELVNRQPKSIPRWIKSYWEGIWDVYMGFTYRYDLEFCHIVNGIRVSNHKESPIYYEKLGISVRDLCNKPCGHYWIKTGKPFFEGEPTPIKEK
jgi:hypothetical protein